MKRRTILLTACGLVLASIVCTGLMPGSGSEVTKDSSAIAPVGPGAAGFGEFRGMCLQLHNAEKDHPYAKYIDEIAQGGAGVLCLVVPGYQENAGSVSIRVKPGRTVTDEKLVELIRLARSKKLRVMLMPMVLLSNPRNNEWRGKIKPDNWDEWWSQYTAFIMKYAKLARLGGAEIFSVGSELVSTETQTGQWKKLISQVRSVFPGLLTYSANWDHYHVPKFWAQLDLVGMTSYFTLAKQANPTPAQLDEAWREIKQEVLVWQKTVNRPILFTEVGWPNQQTAAQFPWNYYAAADKPDPKLQADCFESFFRAWAGEQAVAGFLVWEWRNHPNQKTSPAEDTSYRPCDKPAMKVIQRYFLQPDVMSRQKNKKIFTTKERVEKSNQ